MIYDLKAPYFTSITATEIDHFEVTPETGSVLICKVQRMRSGESSPLRRMWHGSKSPHWRHMWVEFVVGSFLCLKRFFSRQSCIPLYFINQHYQFPILPGMVDEEPFMDVIPLNRYLLIITNKKSNWIPKTVLWSFHTTLILSHAQPQICQYTRLLLILMLTCKPVFSLAQTRRLSKSCINLK